MPRIYEYNYEPTAEDVMSSYINGRMAIAKGHEEYQNFVQNMSDESGPPGDYGWRRMVMGMLQGAKEKQDKQVAQWKEGASAAARTLFGDNPVSSGTSFAERLANTGVSPEQGYVEDRSAIAPMSAAGKIAAKATAFVTGLPGAIAQTYGSTPPATGLAKEAGLGDIQSRLRRRPQSFVLGK